MKMKKMPGMAAVAVVFLMMLAGCQEKEGPAEKAGKQIDQAAAELSERVEKATQ